MNARDSDPVTMAALPTDHELLQHATAKALTGLYPGPTANASQERERQLFHERVMTRLKHYAPETLQLILTSITPVLRSKAEFSNRTTRKEWPVHLKTSTGHSAVTVIRYPTSRIWSVEFNVLCD